MILNELGERGLNGVLQSRLNMVGDAPSPSLTPEVQPALVLESDRPEWSYFKAENLWSVFVNRSGGGATFTSALIEAPRGQLVVIESIQMSLSAGNWDLGWITSLPVYGLTDIFSVQSRDARDTALGRFSIITGDTAASPTFPFGTIMRVPNTTGIEVRGPWVLADEKRALLLKAATTNLTLQATFKGYSRRLLPNELV